MELNDDHRLAEGGSHKSPKERAVGQLRAPGRAGLSRSLPHLFPGSPFLNILLPQPVTGKQRSKDV